MEKQIDFYFDLVSPYSYVASLLIEDIAERNDVALQWKPLLLGGVFKAVGSADVPVSAKLSYMIKDLRRLSKYHDIPFRMPPVFPLRTVLAMRTLIGLEQEQIPQAAHALFNDYWVRSFDLENPDVVGLQAGFDAVDQAETQEIKDALFQATEEAVKRGVFGAPTFFVGEQMFFGHDRLPLLESYLRGEL